MKRLERIVAVCGGVLLDGGTRALIPGPNHSHKDRSVSLAETEEGRILIHCFSPRDDWRDVRRALADQGLLDDEGQHSAPSSLRRAPIITAQPQSEERLARAQRIWDEGVAIEHTPAAAYLRRRAIEAEGVSALRFHPRMTSLDDRLRRPALLAAIHDGAGALQGVQVTLLTAYGAAKAAVVTPRRVVGRLMSGAVRLATPGETLAIGEGVETMLSASLALRTPAWAALSAANLAAFSPPEGVRRLIIAADRDGPGAHAGDVLIARLAGALAVELSPPPAPFKDWNEWRLAAERS